MKNLLSERTSNITHFLLVYGLGHALVDAASAFLVLGVMDPQANLWLFIVLYNVLAFGLQAPFGHFLDKYPKPRLAAVAGLLSVGVAYFFFRTPMWAVALAGTGNALFHIGGGQISLSIHFRKAIYPGIFVAPGGIGLVLGIYLATSKIVVHPWLFPVALLIMSGVLFSSSVPAYSPIKASPHKFNYLAVIILVLVISIIVRSVIGLCMSFPWKTDVHLLIWLTLAIALGKALGGILADRFGWMTTGLSGLLLATPLLAFGASNPIAGLAGILLFNFTMPVTLVAISRVLPGRAGLSFGITTLALLIGAIPAFTQYKGWFSQEGVVFVLILFSAAFLYVGLKFILKQEQQALSSDIDIIKKEPHGI